MNLEKFAERNRKFLEKMRSLPEQKKKLVLWTIVSVLAIILGSFWVNSAINRFSKINISNMPNMPSLNNSKTSISLDQATAIVQNFIAEDLQAEDLVIQNDKTIKKDYGWIFFITTKKYLETKNPEYLIPGIGPLVVDSNGNAHWLGTSVPPEKAIEEYENSIK